MNTLVRHRIDTLYICKDKEVKEVRREVNLGGRITERGGQREHERCEGKRHPVEDKKLQWSGRMPS